LTESVLAAERFAFTAGAFVFAAELFAVAAFTGFTAAVFVALDFFAFGAAAGFAAFLSPIFSIFMLMGDPSVFRLLRASRHRLRNG
jgi:hypothetical protein